MATSKLALAGMYKGLTTIPGWQVRDLAQGDNKKGRLYSTSPWAKACIDMRADALAQIEWAIYDENEDELEKDDPRAAPIYTLFDTIDGSLNWNDLIRMYVQDMLIHGKAFWAKIYGQDSGGNAEGSVPIRLKRLNPNTVDVIGGPDGIDGFKQTFDGGRKPEMFNRAEVVYFHSFDPDDDLGGLGPASVAQNAIDIENFADRYLKSFFQNRAVPDVIYSTEEILDDVDYSRVRRWLNKFKGVDNQHKSAIMEKGLKPTVISFPLSDLALGEVRLEARRSICAVIGVPMSLVGANPSANFATADNERKSLYTEHVIPDGMYFASVVNSELIADFDPELEFVWEVGELPIMQPDAKSEADRVAILVNASIIKPEAAALAAGFSLADVPGYDENGNKIEKPDVPGFSSDGMPTNPAMPQPGVTPPALAPFAQAAGQAEVPETSQKAIDADLKRWQRKALAKIAKGKSAAVEFESEVIPAALKAAIMGQLGTCEIADEVRHIFSARMDEPAPATSLKDVIELAKALRPDPPAEKGWITVNGAHVLVGEDDSSGSGGGGSGDGGGGGGDGGGDGGGGGDGASADKINKEVNKFAEKYQKAPVEHGVLIAPDGSVSEIPTGNSGAIVMSGKDVPAGSVQIHNHPIPTTFSLADVQTMKTAKLAEMHVVDSAGNRYVMRQKDANSVVSEARVTTQISKMNKTALEHASASGVTDFEMAFADSLSQQYGAGALDKIGLEYKQSSSVKAKLRSESAQNGIVINVNVPAQEPPTVNVAGAVVNLPAPETTVNVDAPVINVDIPEDAMKGQAVPPKLVSRTETQRVNRDRTGNIDTTESQVDYHYEGE